MSSSSDGNRLLAGSSVLGLFRRDAGTFSASVVKKENSDRSSVKSWKPSSVGFETPPSPTGPRSNSKVISAGSKVGVEEWFSDNHSTRLKRGISMKGAGMTDLEKVIPQTQRLEEGNLTTRTLLIEEALNDDNIASSSYSKENSLPLYGCNLKFLKRILAFSRKFDADFELTVTQVLEKVVVPMTLTSRVSVATYLKNNYNETLEPRVETCFQGNFSTKADVYVIYARSFSFYELVSCLECYAEKNIKPGHTKEDVYFWMDIFSANQFRNLNDDWLLKSNYKIIKEIESTCLVMMPFENAEPLSRCWCLYELFVASQHKKKLCYQFKKSRYIDFEKSLYNSYQYLKETVVPLVSIDESDCYDVSEQSTIIKVLSNMVSDPDKIRGINNTIDDYLIDQFYDRCISSMTSWLALQETDILRVQHRYSNHSVILDLCLPANSRDEKNLNLLPMRLLETTGMITLATVYYHKGDLERAIGTYVKLLDLHRTILTAEHPSTGSIYNNLAMFYKRIGDLENAKVYYKKSLRVKKILFGKHHPSIVTTNINLALLMKALGKNYVAKSIFITALGEIEAMHGSRCQESIKIVELIVECCLELDDSRDSISFLRHCLDLHLRYDGQNHPDTINVQESLATMVARSDDIAIGATMLEQSLASRMAVYGPKHPSTLDTLLRLAVIRLSLRDFEVSKALFTRVFKVISVKHSTMSYDDKDRFCLESLGDISAEMNHYKDAIKYYEIAFESCRKQLGDHQVTYRVAFKLADTYLLITKFDECYDLFKFSFEGRAKLLGPHSSYALEAKFGLANTLVTLFRYKEAKVLLFEILDDFDRVYGSMSSQSLDALDVLAVVHQKLGDVDSAKETYQRIISHYETLNGKDSVEAKQYSEKISHIYEKHINHH